MLIFISTLLVHTVSAQENITNETLGNNDIITPKDTTLESSQNSDTEKEILIESQRNFDRSLDILNIVATLIGVLVGLLTLIIIIAIAVGVFELKNWRAVIKKAEDEVNRIQNMRNNAENDLNAMRHEFEKLPHLPLTEKPPEELKKKYDNLSSRLELIEMLGVSLKPEDYYDRGVDFYYKENYELALKAFEKAIELKSDYVDALINKGSALDKLDRHDEALQAYEKAIELKSDFADAWNNKGFALNSLGRYKEALQASEKAIELKSDDATAWYNKGITLGNLGWYDEELQAYEKTIELKPDHIEAWYNKGFTLNKLNRHDEALQAYEKAIELKPDYASAWYNLACVYSIKEEKEKALSHLKNAIDLDISYKEQAKEDKDFEELWDDEEFKKLVE